MKDNLDHIDCIVQRSLAIWQVAGSCNVVILNVGCRRLSNLIPLY